MLDVTPSQVEAVYECLRSFEPWSSLRLPSADEVEFHVKSRKDIYGEYSHNGVSHRIKISAALIGSFDSLAKTVGHEMLHLAQAEQGTVTASQHNQDWRRLAKIACATMLWDERAF